ncbi:MAG: NOL1/NOP2/sun family putative RNA methylase [Nanobdellota archaeon]
MSIYDNDRIESADKVEIKKEFEKRYRQLLGKRYDKFIEYSFTYLRRCIRINTLKGSVEEIKQRVENEGWILSPVPWCEEGFFVQGHKNENRFDIGNSIEHALGNIYIQEAASMLPAVVLFDDRESLSKEQKQSFRVLDLCSAPGSKTSQIAQYMENEGILIANDVDTTRLTPLAINLERMGIFNTTITKNSFQKTPKVTTLHNPFKKTHPVGYFDRVLVDAPCSGTGTIRRSFKAVTMYSQGLVKRFSAVQKSLLSNAFELTKPGGTIIYSTCTQEPEENEGVISAFLEQHPSAEVLPISLDITRSEPVTSFEGEKYTDKVKKCLRIYPQDNDSEGFFVCKIRKKIFIPNE